MRGGGAEARDSAGPGSRGGPAASPSLPVLWRGGRSAGLRSLGAKGSVLHVDGPGGLGRAGPEPARVGREPESLGRAQDARRDDDERQVAERELQGCVGGQDQDFRTQAQLKGCSRLQDHHDHLHTLRAGRPRPLREESSEFSSTQGPSERPLGEGAASRQPPPRPRGKLCLATSPPTPQAVEVLLRLSASWRVICGAWLGAWSPGSSGPLASLQSPSRPLTWAASGARAGAGQGAPGTAAGSAPAERAEGAR